MSTLIFSWDFEYFKISGLVGKIIPLQKEPSFIRLKKISSSCTVKLLLFITCNIQAVARVTSTLSTHRVLLARLPKFPFKIVSFSKSKTSSAMFLEKHIFQGRANDVIAFILLLIIRFHRSNSLDMGTKEQYKTYKRPPLPTNISSQLL